MKPEEMSEEEWKAWGEMMKETFANGVPPAAPKPSADHIERLNSALLNAGLGVLGSAKIL